MFALFPYFQKESYVDCMFGLVCECVCARARFNESTFRRDWNDFTEFHECCINFIPVKTMLCVCIFPGTSSRPTNMTGI
jgi:hypothetical protein